MKRSFLALTLVGALSAGIMTPAFAAESETRAPGNAGEAQDAEAGIEFYKGPEGIIDPPTTIDPPPPERPGPPGTETPELPPGPPVFPPLPPEVTPPPTDLVEDFGSIGLEFGAHELPRINTRYDSMDASNHPLLDADGKTVTEYEDNSADMFIVAWNNGWSVNVSVGGFKVGGNTITEFHLYLNERSKYTLNPFNHNINVVGTGGNEGTDAYKGMGGLTSKDDGSLGASKTVIETSEMGTYGVRFQGILDVAAGKGFTGDAQAELKWTFVSGAPA